MIRSVKIIKVRLYLKNPTVRVGTIETRRIDLDFRDGVVSGRRTNSHLSVRWLIRRR